MTTQLDLPEPAPLASLARLSSYPWLVVGTVCIGNFMGQTDASIVQLAMPAFEDAFDAPLSAVSWVAVGYVVAFAAALPAFARLAEIAGRKTLYLAGFVLFGVFSAACALAPSLAGLIAFRILLGIGGALLGANSVVVLVAAAGPERRGKALGVMAAAQAVGLSAGPALGGVLLGLFGWRSIFWVAVPSAALGAALGWLILPKTAKRMTGQRFDVIGALLLAPALATLLLAITEARHWGLAPPMIACLVAAPTLLIAFIGRELTTSDPLVDLRLFRKPAFSAGSIGVLLSYAMLYGVLLCDVVCARARLPRPGLFGRPPPDRRAGRAGPHRSFCRRSFGAVAEVDHASWHGGLRRRRAGAEPARPRNAPGTALEPRRGHGGPGRVRPRARPLHRAEQQRHVGARRPRNQASPAVSSTFFVCSARALASPRRRRRSPRGLKLRPVCTIARAALPNPRCFRRSRRRSFC